MGGVMPLNLVWEKCQGDVWCSFENVNTDTINSNGVYVIWHGGDTARVVYVGQGDVSARLIDHRRDYRITYYSQFRLFVTWADVALADRDGVERYLAESLNPTVGDVYPAAAPIAVNAPW